MRATGCGTSSNTARSPVSMVMLMLNKQPRTAYLHDAIWPEPRQASITVAWLRKNTRVAVITPGANRLRYLRLRLRAPPMAACLGAAPSCWGR